MQIDIHHAGIYALCRIAGMKSVYANIVAYSSQQVDDANYGHALKFTNKDVFKQTMTSYDALSPFNLNVSDALEVWMPFHFLPNGDKQNYQDALITSPDSKVLDFLLEDLLSAGNPETALYRLGIGMHSFADTFSHQDFKGFYDDYNHVDLVNGFDERGFQDNVLRLAFKLINGLGVVVAIGHGQVLTNPDIPNAVWTYQRKGRKIEVKNLEERFLPGLERMLEYLTLFISRNPQYGSGLKNGSFSAYRDLFTKLLTNPGTSEERHNEWLENIRNNGFSLRDFDETDQKLSYSKRQWFNEAVEKKKVNRFTHFHYKIYNYYEFTKKEGFDNSHWVKYMKGAYEHKHFIIHKALPQLGMNVG